MNIEKARQIIGKENAKKKWEKYDTLDKRKKVLSKAHEGVRRYWAKKKGEKNLSTSKSGQ